MTKPAYLIIFAADIHADKQLYRSCPNAQWDSVSSFRSILHMADYYSKFHHCPVPVILGGDIWDTTKVTSEVVFSMIAARDQYPEVPLYFINGNHDACEPSWSLLLGANHLGPEIVTLPGGAEVVGIDYTRKDKFEEALDKVEKGADFLIVHQFIEESDDTIIQSSIPVSVFDGKYSTVLAGDVHYPHCVSNEHTKVYYPGPSNRRTIKEPEGGYMLISPVEIPDMGMSRLDQNFWYANMGIAVRQLYEHTIDGGLTSDKVPEVLEVINNSENWIVTPYWVIYADYFDAEAVRELHEKGDSEANFIFRRKIVSEEDDKLIDAIPERGSAKASEYAVDAISSLDTIDPMVKELGVRMFQDEEGFFQEIRQKLKLV